MTYQNNFKRMESKYIINEFQKKQLMKRLEGIAEVDEYGETTICNIYYDTPDFRLIRTSLEKPVYKEKLRLRTYGAADNSSESFVEIKKKFKGTVYKRRIALPYVEALEILNEGGEFDTGSQIGREINAFTEFYGELQPAMVISYDRVALKGMKDPAIRLTLDRNIRWRADMLDLRYGASGKCLLDSGASLLEIKIEGAMDMEIARILSDLEIRQVSFSKYGRGYQEYMIGKMHTADSIAAFAGAFVNRKSKKEVAVYA